MWKNAQRSKPSDAACVFDAVGQSRSAQSQATAAVEDDEVDPLDAYMAQLEKETQEPANKKQKTEAVIMESEDATASYYDEVEGKKTGKQVEGDSDSENQGNASDEEGDRRRKPIEALEAIDHSKIAYEAFRKDFYVEHEDIKRLNTEEVSELKSSMNISATGSDVPRPVCSFAHFGFKKDIMDTLRKMEFTRPTPIQSQAIPCALKGRDVIGIAETGSGKTLAYVLPMLIHVLDQRHIEKGEGPIVLTLCPTRELSVQIEKEIHRCGKKMGITSVTLVGGLSKHEQFKICKAGCEILIGTPGRVIDVIKLKGITLTRVTYVVLDEADRMFDMGFEYQMQSIVRNTRPDRQTLLFSATFPPAIERLARNSLANPVRITIGKVGQATENVEQRVFLVKDEEKWNWIAQHVCAMTTEGQVMIFVGSRKAVEDLRSNFESYLEMRVSFLHGDLDQGERMSMLRQYRKGETKVLVATDVASRGLDIASIRYVISYDAASTIETHTHRIGRTGRAGEKGVAVTLLTRKEKKLAANLVEQLETQRQDVPNDVLQLALTHPPFQAARATGSTMQSKGKGKGGKIGLGFEGGERVPTKKALNKKADMQFERNRVAQQGGQKDPNQAITGFVAAKINNANAKIESTEVSSDSDDDLFAPGVTAKFGVANRIAAQPHRTGFAPSPVMFQQQPVQSVDLATLISPQCAPKRDRRSKWDE